MLVQYIYMYLTVALQEVLFLQYLSIYNRNSRYMSVVQKLI